MISGPPQAFKVSGHHRSPGVRREFLLGSVLPPPHPFSPSGVNSTFEGSEMNSAGVLGRGATEYLPVKSSTLPLWKGAGVTDPTLQSMHPCREDDREPRREPVLFCPLASSSPLKGRFGGGWTLEGIFLAGLRLAPPPHTRASYQKRGRGKSHTEVR